MEQNKFRIQSTVFEGPLDLLLTLIEKRKLFINDVSLAQVTDDFITYIKSLGQLPISEATNFVYIASTLILIKSKSLLPSLSLTHEEEQSIEDLEDRLTLHKFFKTLSGKIENNFGKRIIFGRSFTKAVEPLFSPSQDLSIDALAGSINTVIARFPKEEAALKKVAVKKVMSLDDMVSNLTERMQKTMQLSFKEFAGIGKQEKVYVIVSFLALLELTKQEIISVRQDSHFEDIHIQNQDITTPRYG